MEFDWSFIPAHFFDQRLLQGAGMTIFLSLVAQTAGVLLGLVAALMRLSKNPILRGVAGF
jgi:polar amino acid transport system permease protein